MELVTLCFTVMAYAYNCAMATLLLIGLTALSALLIALAVKAWREI